MGAAASSLDMKTVKTTCPYCGVGCGMVLQVEGGKVTKLSGDKTHPTNFGRLCTKGSTAAKIIAGTGRMERASVRADRKADQLPVPIDAAIAQTAARLRTIIDTHGPDAVALYVSGQMAMEAQYLANKLAKGFIGTNNIESNSRYCMASAASGYKLSLGADGPPGSYQDFDHADLFFIAGSNMADCHPILFLRMKDRMKSAGAKLIVVDPRRTATAEAADLFLQIKPGTDIALFNGLLHLLVEADRIERDFIAEFTEGWDAMPAFLADYTPSRVAETTGISEADLRKAATWIGEARDWMSCWTMGLSQSISGTWNTNALCNLHLATGAICRPGSGPFSLTGQPNAMGGREMGYLGYGLPGQRSVAYEDERRFTEEVWGLAPGTIRPEPGTDASAMFKAMQTGDIKAVWVICTNPVATTPNRAHAVAGLKAAELVITQDSYQDNETNIYADILLPGALWAEATGVMVNSERNLTLMEKAVEPPGDAMPDWQIIAKVACALGYEKAFSYQSSAEVFDEIKRFWNPRTGYDLRGASHERLRQTPLQWPCPPETAADRNPIRYINDGISQTQRVGDNGTKPKLTFPTPSGRAQFFARPVVAQSEYPDEDFPFVLNTGRLPHQWHTLTKTGKVQTLNKLNPGPFIEIHPDDAKAAGIAEKDEVEVRSRRGKAILPARVSTRVQRGACFVPFHWNDSYGDNLAINAVTTDASDPISKQAAFKYCAVSLERVGPALSSAKVAVKEGEAPTPRAVVAQTGRGRWCHDGVETEDRNHGEHLRVGDQPAADRAAVVHRGRDRLSLRLHVRPGVGRGAGLHAGPAAERARRAQHPAVARWRAGRHVQPHRHRRPRRGRRATGGGRRKGVTVLYASQTGNSEALAETIASSLAGADMQARALPMDEYDTGALATETQLIFVSSTYGDGDPPDNGKAFWDFLRSEAAPRLEHLSYAICALGDPSYDQFCNHGKNLDARLTELGAKRLQDRIDCDPDYESQSVSWVEALPPLFAKSDGGAKANGAAHPAATKGNGPNGRDGGAPSGWSKTNPFRAKLVGNVKLNGEGASKDTRYFRFSLEGSGLTYETGDALGVWPSNCDEMVAEIVAATGLDAGSRRSPSRARRDATRAGAPARVRADAAEPRHAPADRRAQRQKGSGIAPRRRM